MTKNELKLLDASLAQIKGHLDIIETVKRLISETLAAYDATPAPVQMPLVTTDKANLALAYLRHDAELSDTDDDSKVVFDAAMDVLKRYFTQSHASA